MNEHILTGSLTQKLLGLGLTEATHKSWRETPPHTYIDGSKPIDAVYHSHELEITSTMQLSFHEGVGDHRTAIIDISSRSLIGKDLFKVVRQLARKLTSANPKAVKKYTTYVETKLCTRQLCEHLQDTSQALLHDKGNPMPTTAWKQSIDRPRRYW